MNVETYFEPDSDSIDFTTSRGDAYENQPSLPLVLKGVWIRLFLFGDGQEVKHGNGWNKVGTYDANGKKRRFVEAVLDSRGIKRLLTSRRVSAVYAGGGVC